MTPFLHALICSRAHDPICRAIVSLFSRVVGVVTRVVLVLHGKVFGLDYSLGTSPFTLPFAEIQLLFIPFSSNSTSSQFEPCPRLPLTTFLCFQVAANPSVVLKH
jgi:hypothetical protein